MIANRGNATIFVHAPRCMAGPGQMNLPPPASTVFMLQMHLVAAMSSPCLQIPPDAVELLSNWPHPSGAASQDATADRRNKGNFCRGLRSYAPQSGRKLHLSSSDCVLPGFRARLLLCQRRGIGGPSQSLKAVRFCSIAWAVHGRLDMTLIKCPSHDFRQVGPSKRLRDQ